MAFFPGSLPHQRDHRAAGRQLLRRAGGGGGIAERRADFARPQLDEAKEVAELERTREKRCAIGALHAEQQGTFEIREYVEEEWAAAAAARGGAAAGARRGGRRRQGVQLPTRPKAPSPAFVRQPT